jgi:hypothetical protein
MRDNTHVFNFINATFSFAEPASPVEFFGTWVFHVAIY